VPSGEFDYKNLDFNSNRYTTGEWEQVKERMPRRVFGVHVMHVSDFAGRTHYKSRFMRWVYDRDLTSLFYPAIGFIAAVGIVMMIIVIAWWIAL